MIFSIMDFTDLESPWFQLALTHRSHSATNNERLEFVGDALLGAVLAEEIYRRYPEADEGLMTLIRARLVNAKTLAELAIESGLAEVLEQKWPAENKQLASQSSVLADTLEAWLAAVYFARGMTELRQVLDKLYQNRWKNLEQWVDSDAHDLKQSLKNPKSLLQEMMQKRGYPPPAYQMIEKRGQPHQAVFCVECRVEAFNIQTVGCGYRRRHAENHAAQLALQTLEDKTSTQQSV